MLDGLTLNPAGRYDDFTDLDPDVFVPNVRMVADIFTFKLLNPSLSDVAGLPMLSLSASPMECLNLLVKGLEDGVLAGDDLAVHAAHRHWR